MRCLPPSLPGDLSSKLTIERPEAAKSAKDNKPASRHRHKSNRAARHSDRDDGGSNHSFCSRDTRSDAGSSDGGALRDVLAF